MIRDHLQRLTRRGKIWCAALLATILFSTLLFAHFILTRPRLQEKRILSRAEAVGKLLLAREITTESPYCAVLSGVTVGDVPAAQLKLTFAAGFPGTIRLVKAEFSGAELRIDPVTGELNGKKIPEFLHSLREAFPAILLPENLQQRLSADGYLDSGSRSSSFHFDCCREKRGIRLEFRSGSCRADGMLGGKDETFHAAFSGSGSLFSPVLGALPEGAELAGEADWRWSLFRSGKGPLQSILSGRFGVDGGTIVLRGAALRFAPESQVDFHCSGDEFSGMVSKGTLLHPRIELQKLSFRAGEKGGLAFSGMAQLSRIPGARHDSLTQFFPVKGYFVPQEKVLHAEAVMEKVSPDVFLPLAGFLPGKSLPDKMLWTIDQNDSRGSFRMECDFAVMRFDRAGTAEKVLLSLQSQIHSTEFGYILPKSRVELSAGHFKTPFCELQDLSLCRVTHGGNDSFELSAGSGSFTAGKNGTFTMQNGKLRFQEKNGVFNGFISAGKLVQTRNNEEWFVREPLFSFRYVPKTCELSLGGRAAALQRKTPGGAMQAEECSLEASCGNAGWEGTLQAASLFRNTGKIPLKLGKVQIRHAAGLTLLRAETVAGRWREADFRGENFQLRGTDDFRCDKLHFNLAQAWEGTCAAIEHQSGVLRCTGISLSSTAQKKNESLSFADADLMMKGDNGSLRIGRIEGPGNWQGSAELSAERTAEGLRFFGNMTANPARDNWMLSGSFRLAEQGNERIRAAFRRAPRQLPAALQLMPEENRNVILTVKGRTGISGEYRFADRSFAGDLTYQLVDAELAMEQDYLRLSGVKTELTTDFSNGRVKDGTVPLRFASGILGNALYIGSGEAALQIRDRKLALHGLQTLAMGGTLQMEQFLQFNGTPYHQMYFKAATIRPAELAGGGFGGRCDGVFRVGNGEFGCSLKGGNGHLHLASLAPFASREKSTLNDFVQAALVNFNANVLQLDYLGRADGSGKMHILTSGAPEKPLPFSFDEVRQKFDPIEPGEPGFLGEIDLAVDYHFPAEANRSETIHP